MNEWPFSLFFHSFDSQFLGKGTGFHFLAFEPSAFEFKKINFSLKLANVM